LGLRRGNRDWRRLHNDELNDLYSSPNIIRVIKSRRRRLAGHLKRMGQSSVVCRVMLGHLRERSHFEDLGVDGMILK
jgi:hypothetical protein